MWNTQLGRNFGIQIVPAADIKIDGGTPGIEHNPYTTGRQCRCLETTEHLRSQAFTLQGRVNPHVTHLPQALFHRLNPPAGEENVILR